MAKKSSSTKATNKKPSQRANNKNSLSKDQRISLYEKMMLIRRFEEKAGQLYGMGLIGGFCHLYIGQEAVVVGIQSILNDNDAMITSYRDHGHMLAMDMDPGRIMAELTGRITGYSKGKGGSMHMFSKENNFYGGHGIVGAQVPLGTGLAFAQQKMKTGGITVAFFGDGASNQGQVYEAFNMAGIWKLPIIYVIENNRYGMGTKVERVSASGESLCDRGKVFGIPGEVVDGMDVEKVRMATKKAIDYVRGGKGPMILEMKTYRYRGHSMSDPAKYRSKDEVTQMRDHHDPIDNYRQTLLKDKVLAEEKIKEIDKSVKNIVTQAAEFAKDSPLPDASELWTDIIEETPCQ